MVNSITREPIKGVHVRLVAVPLRAPGSMVYGAMTDAAGKFSVNPIEPGSYYATVEHPGFIARAAARPLAKLKAGERRGDIRLEMAPLAFISGRVVDEYGDPVQSVPVQATPTAGRTVYALMFNSVTTDDRGEFRVSVGPGRYNVKAAPYSGSFGEPGEVRSDGTSQPVYGETYYPSAATPERAVVVDVAGGREVTGIEIRLARRPSLTVSGVVTGAPAGFPPAAATLASILPNERGAGSQSTSLGPDGKFAFTNLAPGFYRLHAQAEFREQQLYSPMLEFTLEDAGITGLQLALAPAEDLTGSVRFEGEPAGTQLEGLTVRLDAAATAGAAGRESGPAKAGKDGAFRISAVPPGRYRVRVEPMPENGYVKFVRLDGAAAPGGVLDLTRGAGGSVGIVISRNGAQVSGAVKTRDENPASETDGTVYLFQDPEHIRPENLGKITAEGTYVFKGVRPGRYRLVAAEPLFLAGAGSEGPKELAARAEQIEVKEGDRLTKDLTLITTEDADAKQKR